MSFMKRMGLTCLVLAITLLVAYLTPYGAPKFVEVDYSQDLEYDVQGDETMVIGMGDCTDVYLVLPSDYSGMAETWKNAYPNIPVTCSDGMSIAIVT